MIAYLGKKCKSHLDRIALFCYNGENYEKGGRTVLFVKIPATLCRVIRKFLLPNLILGTIFLLFLFLDTLELFDGLIVCPLHHFGLYCPTCGMTRAAHALLALDIEQSFRYHPLLLPLLLMVAYYELGYLGSLIVKRPVLRHPRRVLYGTIAAFTAFFILRNVLLLAFGIDMVGDFIR